MHVIEVMYDLLTGVLLVLNKFFVTTFWLSESNIFVSCHFSSGFILLL